MPDLGFRVTGVESTSHGLTPLLGFKLEVTNAPESERIESVMLQAQIQIQSPRRPYNPTEQELLSDLFGRPDRWGQTLRDRLWTHAQVVVPKFAGTTEVVLPVTCTFDLNIAATKYFHALQGGDIPLLFLFSGTVFYNNHDGRMQIGQISWNSECTYRMPVDSWKKMMDELYPNIGWLTLQRDTLDRLYSYRLRNGLISWDRTIEKLLDELESEEARP
jgi:hypothetical protein